MYQIPSTRLASHPNTLGLGLGLSLSLSLILP
jgi:hypothetical protein